MAEDRDRTWYEFTQDVTMHGVRYVHLRKITIVRRLIWLSMIVASLVYFSYASALFLKDYSQKKVSTKVSVETAEQLQFPTVTICNNNLWSFRAMVTASLRLETFGLFQVMQDLYDPSLELPPPAHRYNWSHPNWAPIANLTENETQTLLREAAHPLTSTIYECSIFGEDVLCEDVFEVVPTDRGFCFQFNTNGTLNATSAGKTGGISMVLDAHVEQYTTGPASYSEGFSITFHESHEVPIVAELGIGLSPGTQANVVLHKSSTNRVPPPADGGKANCFDAIKQPNPLHYYDKYSFAACQVECKTSYVISKCGCRDPFQPPLNNTPFCSFPMMLNCSAPVLRNFTRDPEGLATCHCRDPCVVSEYTAKMSTNKFPSTNYALFQGYDAGQIVFVENNEVMVNIFYGKMSYQRLDEEIAYDIVDMVANVGGTLGLCIGASIITICEFIEFGVLSLVRRIKGKHKVKPQSTVHINVAPAQDSLA